MLLLRVGMTCSIARSLTAPAPRPVQPPVPDPWRWPSFDTALTHHGRVHRVDELVPTLLRTTLRLFRGDVAALSMFDFRAQRFRIVGVVSADARWSEWRSLMCRVPTELAPTPHAPVRDVLVLPDDDPTHAFVTLLGAHRAIYVTLGARTLPIGAVHVIRRAAQPFAASDRKLALRIADRATTALNAIYG